MVFFLNFATCLNQLLTNCVRVFSPMQTLRNLQMDVAALLKREQVLEVQEDNDDLWMQVCYRLDIVALIVSNALNLHMFLVYTKQY